MPDRLKETGTPVDAQAFTEAGPFGDLPALYSQQVGVAGLVIDGSVRDSRTMVGMGLPSSLGVSASRAPAIPTSAPSIRPSPAAASPSTPVTPWSVMHGVVVVPAHGIDRVIELAEARERKESDHQGRPATVPIATR